MSGPQTPSPNRHSPGTEPVAQTVLPDPLLDSDSFIHQDDAVERPEDHQPEEARDPQFGLGEVIVAEPISVYDPSEDAAEATPTRSASRRRNPEEMGKRPSWLPEDWQMELRVRASGASAGLIDRYYVEPLGQRKFRSKTEVMHFLETGSKLKRKSMADGDAAPSATPAGKKGKKKTSSSSKDKSNTKHKKSEASTSDSVHSIQPDTAQEV